MKTRFKKKKRIYNRNWVRAESRGRGRSAHYMFQTSLSYQRRCFFNNNNNHKSKQTSRWAGWGWEDSSVRKMLALHP